MNCERDEMNCGDVILSAFVLGAFNELVGLIDEYQDGIAITSTVENLPCYGTPLRENDWCCEGARKRVEPILS